MGYLAVRLSRRLRVPVVTSFMLLGILAGPEGLNLVNSSALHSLRVVEPVALGMITFAAGEQLFFGDLRWLSRRSYAVVALETVLPVLLVGMGAWLVTGRLEVALPVAAIAGTTGLATVMSTLRESGAKGDYAKLLGFSIASDNFFAILAFSLVLPLAVGIETGKAIGGLYADRLIGMVASVAIGFVAGIVISRLVRQVRSSQELSMLVLAHVLLVVGVTEYLGYSVLLAGLAMGTTAVNMTRKVRDRERAFAAMVSIEFPVVAIFFLWAGASLHVRALGSIGVLFAVYVGARVIGKLAGPLLTAWAVRGDSEQSRRFVGLGVSLLPQAGAAVGLGILAQETLPKSGETILAAVLAAVVVFEVIGPLGVHWAAKHVGEAKAVPDGQPLTLDEAIGELQNRRARVAALVGTGAEASMLRAPRMLAVRLGADLLVVPVSDTSASSRDPSLWGFSADQDPDGVCRNDESKFEGCRETVIDAVSAGRRSADQLMSILTDYSPDVILLASEGLPSCVLEIAEDLSRRLDCPVLRVPMPGAAQDGRSWPVRRVAQALGRSRSLWRGSREWWSGREAAGTRPLAETEVLKAARATADEDA